MTFADIPGTLLLSIIMPAAVVFWWHALAYGLPFILAKTLSKRLRCQQTFRLQIYPKELQTVEIMAQKKIGYCVLLFLVCVSYYWNLDKSPQRYGRKQAEVYWYLPR